MDSTDYPTVNKPDITGYRSPTKGQLQQPKTKKRHLKFTVKSLEVSI